MTLLEIYNSFKKYLNKSGGNGCQNLTFTVTVKNQFDITEGLNESQFFSFVSSKFGLKCRKSRKFSGSKIKRFIPKHIKFL